MVMPVVAFVFVLFLPFIFLYLKYFWMSSFFHSSSSSSSYYVPESQDVVFIETTICLKCLANWILIMLQNNREVYSIHFYFVIFLFFY